MISAGDFRKGMTIVIDGQVYPVVDFQHVKPGKGAAFVRTKIKTPLLVVFWKEPLALLKGFQGLMLKPRRCNTYTTMGICTILWILKHTSKYP